MKQAQDIYYNQSSNEDPLELIFDGYQPLKEWLTIDLGQIHSQYCFHFPTSQMDWARILAI